MANEHSGGKPETHVEVVVVTTSGSYPATGTDRVSAHQPVRNELAKAAHELHIVDTTGWIARVAAKAGPPPLCQRTSGVRQGFGAVALKSVRLVR